MKIRRQGRLAERYLVKSGLALFSLIALSLPIVLVGVQQATAAPAGPAGVTNGLRLWLTASSGVKTVGGVDAQNGDGVEQWLDQSPDGRDATKATTSAIYNSEGLNFNPTLFFSDNNYTASDSGLPSGSDDRSIFVVASANSGGWRYVLGGGTFGGDGGFDFGHNSNDQSVFLTTHSSQYAGTGSWEPYGSARLAYGALDGSYPYIAVNGSAPVNGIGGSASTVLDGDLNIGANSAGVELWDGNISEVIYYDRVVTPVERQRINSYLALKYGFSLDQAPAQSYIASGGVIMWDKDAPGANVYNNGLFGIGRDDAAGLSQIKSLGQTATNMITVEAVGEGTNTAPNFNDVDNLEFLVIGDNDGAASWTTTGAPGSYSILERKWMKQERGDVGPVELTFNMDDPEMDIPAPLGDGYYYFIYDTDGDGSLADETPTALVNQGGGIWKTTVDFGAGGLFTIATSASPAIVSLSPANNAGDVALSSNLTINYSRAVTAGSGYVSLYKSNGQLVERLLATDATRVVITGAMVTLNPTDDLEPGTDYYLLVDATAFGDLPDYAPGITSQTAWSFSTASALSGGSVVQPGSGVAAPNTGIHPGVQLQSEVVPVLTFALLIAASFVGVITLLVRRKR